MRLRSLVPALGLAAGLGACDGGGDPEAARAIRDADRRQYEADKAHCDSISNLEAARKSCMTYRGWPDGKFRR